MRYSKDGNISNDAPACLYKKSMKQIALDPLSIAANAGQTTKKYKNTI